MTADKHGLVGWVRNEPDHTVAGVVQGPVEKVQVMYVLVISKTLSLIFLIILLYILFIIGLGIIVYCSSDILHFINIHVMTYNFMFCPSFRI